MTTPTDADLAHLNLGQATSYPSRYTPGLLQGVPRARNREPIGITASLPFQGVDYWNGYELSWLNENGVPQVATATFAVPITSPNLVESKSFKLYLNSFNEDKFSSWSQVQQLMTQDLSACAGAPVTVELHGLDSTTHQLDNQLPGTCIDHQAVQLSQYDYDPSLLQLRQPTITVSETLHSHVLKSNCLITNQPDWGSVVVKYEGPALDHAALLAYIVSFRRHNEFHEQCVERIFADIQRLGIAKLTVYARYTRRGGLDINPFRSNFEAAPAQQRLVRQ